MGLTALCPGSYDPATNGHLDIIERAARRFDAVIVGVLDNPSKRPLFPVEERVGMLKELTAGIRGVEVEAFSGLLVDHARRRGADVVVKGLRSEADFAYEQQMAQMNRHVGDVETVFLATSPSWSFLSSTLVKEVARMGGDVSGLVPPLVAERLAAALGGN